NPWRWSFDPASGDLWAADVGQSLWEEINIVQRGGNYGWPIREGAHCYNASTCSTAGLTDPVAEYQHTGGPSAVIGGYVYRGSAIPELQGAYVFGDGSQHRLLALVPASAGHYEIKPIADLEGAVHFVPDAVGELLVLAGYRGYLI